MCRDRSSIPQAPMNVLDHQWCGTRASKAAGLVLMVLGSKAKEALHLLCLRIQYQEELVDYLLPERGPEFSELCLLLPQVIPFQRQCWVGINRC